MKVFPLTGYVAFHLYDAVLNPALLSCQTSVKEQQFRLQELKDLDLISREKMFTKHRRSPFGPFLSRLALLTKELIIRN